MAAVLEIGTVHHLTGGERPHLTLVESPVDLRRVYLRRRVAVATVALVLLAALFFVSAAIRGAGSSATGAFDTHHVTSGETLWSIAKDVRPGHDPRDTIAVIASLNSTGNVRFDPWVPIAVGQSIRVPADR